MRGLIVVAVVIALSATASADAPPSPTVTIRLTSPPAGTSVLVDDRRVELDGKALAVAPGRHTIVVIAPGRITHEASFTVAPGAHETVEIPALPAASVDRSQSRRTVARFVLFGGIGMVTTALVLGSYASTLYHRQFPEHCDDSFNGPAQCDVTGQKGIARARVLGNTGTVIGGVGLVTTGIGVYLMVRARKRSDQVTVVPVGSASSAGVAAVGTF